MSRIRIEKKSITRTGTEAVVNAANESLLMGGGVCGIIFRAAGAENLTAACSKIGHCKTGNAVITPGFSLCRYIIHAVGPVWKGGQHNEAKLLYSAYRHSLILCRDNDIHSVTFPLISRGIFGYPKDGAWHKAIQACRDFILQNDDYDIDIVFAVIDDETLKMGQGELESKT